MLTQKEIIDGLKKTGENATSQTLRNREKQGLVTPAYRGENGRPGRSVFYSERCLWENYAAGKLLNSKRLRLTAKQVKIARDLALSMENGKFQWDTLKDTPEYEQLDIRLAEYWYAYFLHAKYGFSIQWAAEITFIIPYDEGMDELHSFQAVTMDINTGKLQTDKATSIYIDITTGNMRVSQYSFSDLNNENLVYIEVEGISC